MAANVGLYLSDPYARSFEARVLEVADDHVVLDRTIFCPGETGQNSDRGWLRWGEKAANVARVDARSGAYWHYLDGNSHRPRVGQTITGELDWTYRHRMMRVHTAYHLVSAIAFHVVGARTTHPELTASGLRLRFKTDCWCDALAKELEARVNEAIIANVPVYTYRLSRAEALDEPLLNRLKIELLPDYIRQVRVVEIQDIALEIDLGTHVRSTREIGTVQFGAITQLEAYRHMVEIRVTARATQPKSPFAATAHGAALPSVSAKSKIKPNQIII